MADNVNKRSPVVETFRQAYVVMKNEIKKYFSGKRMLLFLILLAIVEEVTACCAADCSESKESTCYALLLTEKNEEHNESGNSLNEERNAYIKFGFLKHNKIPFHL